MQKKQKGLVWFRNDLRVHDNESLMNAINENNTVIAVYCFDPRHFEKTGFGFKKTEKFRAKFLIESVKALKHNLEKLNIPLLVYHQKPEDAIQEITVQNEISAVYFQDEWTSEEIEVLENIKANVPDSVSFKSTYNQFLFHPDTIPFEIHKIPNVFTQFRNQCEKSTKIRPEFKVQPLSKENWTTNTTVIPTMKTLGFTDFEADSRTAFPFGGGEDEAKKRLQNYFWETKKLSVYKLTRNGLIGTDFSSKFSPWLASGAMSPRKAYAALKEFEAVHGANDSTYWIWFELLWRDYFRLLHLKCGAQLYRAQGLTSLPPPSHDVRRFDAWCHARTGEPLVDAGMAELGTTGYLSNRMRQIVASYLVHDLGCDWRAGAAWFEAQLIDYDVYSNQGNWLYIAGRGTDPRNGRRFNIQKQVQDHDPDGIYRRLWNTLPI